ncbi:radical SAM/SPASM domain-containing protein [Methylococcus sp. Mc7]|uniref:radical SAM/SPASM domain-containing protein n=1 Tax=Methylococcus sp. Mc7 TaxID=2860258 RepID=UPI001C52FFA7|nr:radical SAM/SPASM domain-containing protein [Methylococcus sp. Mc7]QXP82898.1 radical SAM/SPASM domain-containing protein [Methylococcus sp. Mc7]
MIRYDLIGLTYTRACPLTCRHCITESSPHIKGKMQMEQVSEYLKVIPSFAPGVCFTGGEPMLYYQDILELVRQARDFGLKSSLVTGAGWVRGESSTRSRINTLAAAGLGHICISWDQYHEEFSSRERPLRLARLAIEAGLGVAVRVVAITEAQKEEYHAMFDGLPVYLQSQAPVKLGRATSLRPQHFVRTEEPPLGVCAVVLTPVIEPDGAVYACCGPAYYCGTFSPLKLGNTNDEPLEDILGRAVQDPILEIIFTAGPHGLYQLLRDHPVGRERFKARPEYSGICELCLDITNDTELVNIVRERLADSKAQRLRVASKLWMENKLLPEIRKSQRRQKQIEQEA